MEGGNKRGPASEKTCRPFRYSNDKNILKFLQKFFKKTGFSETKGETYDKIERHMFGVCLVWQNG